MLLIESSIDMIEPALKGNNNQLFHSIYTPSIHELFACFFVTDPNLPFGI